MNAPPRLRRTVPRLALSPDEAAAALGMSRSHFDRHVRHDLKVVLSGARTLYAVDELQRWLDEQGVPPGRRAA